MLGQAGLLEKVTESPGDLVLLPVVTPPLLGQDVRQELPDQRDLGSTRSALRA